VGLLEQRIDYTTVLTERTKFLILGAVLSALFLTSLDQTIVSAALPKILADLGDLDLLSWTSTAYLLVSTTSLPIWGKLSDLYGRKRILLVGMAAFMAGSALCGLAPSMLALVIFRGIQGLGAGAIGAVGLTIPADLYVPAERSRLQGWIASVFAVSGIVGPFLGGFLTDMISWHWIFYINLPFGLPALAAIAIFMPPLESGLKRVQIDFLGAGLLILTVVPLLVAMSVDHEKYTWLSPLIVSFLSLSAISFVLFLGVERRAAEPIVPLSLFKIPSFNLLCAISGLTGGCFITALLFLPIYVVNVLGTTATEAGIALMPETLGFLLTAVLSGYMIQHTGRYKTIMVVGLIFLSAGYGGLSTFTVNSHIQDVWFWMTILGFGIGATFPQVNLALQNAVPYANVGVATSARLFFVQLSQTIGGAVFGAILTAMITSGLTTGLQPIAAKLPQAIAPQLDPYRLRNGGMAEHLKTLDADLARYSVENRIQINEQVHEVVKDAFSTAISRIYSYTLPFVIVSVFLGLFVPELPLRKSNQVKAESLGLEA
jgi:EmrB/QacA subfamily drug resistance transporter